MMSAARIVESRCAMTSEVRPMKSGRRSEEHTSELQSQSNLVCRLLLEKKKITTIASATNASAQGHDTSALQIRYRPSTSWAPPTPLHQSTTRYSVSSAYSALCYLSPAT